MRKFQGPFEQKSALKNCEIGTHFYEPFPPVQLQKGVPIYVLAKVEATIKNLLKEAHIEKLSKCTEDYFILPTVVTAKRRGRVKLALNSKPVNRQVYQSRYQMPNMNQLLDNFALAISDSTSDPFWFSKIRIFDIAVK